MKVKLTTYLVGLAIAFLEEFVTQRILKRNLAGWIIPAIIAFVPFLIVVRHIGKVLARRMIESKAVTAYYLISDHYRVLHGTVGCVFQTEEANPNQGDDPSRICRRRAEDLPKSCPDQNNILVVRG
jgi:hypothetical protein